MNKAQHIARAKAIEQKNKERFLRINKDLNDSSGIYFLIREDEAGIKYAYIGQAKHVLSRLAQHLAGYQHIDLSLKKHGLYSTDNLYGWRVSQLNFMEQDLDEMEKKYIKLYANKGYQLRNKTAGGQGEGKSQIDEYRPTKGYRDGLQQGKKTLARELSYIIDKHLVISIKPEKQNNKISQNALQKFMDLLNEKFYE